MCFLTGKCASDTQKHALAVAAARISMTPLLVHSRGLLDVSSLLEHDPSPLDLLAVSPQRPDTRPQHPHANLGSILSSS